MTFYKGDIVVNKAYGWVWMVEETQSFYEYIKLYTNIFREEE